MAFKTIVAVIRSEVDGKRVLDAILPLIREESAHLIGVHAETTALAYMPAVGMGVASYDQAIIEANRERMEALGKWFDDACGAEDISHEWRGFENYSGDSAISAITSAFTADLIVSQQTDPSNPEDASTNVETLVFETGRPVLLVPYTNGGPLKLDKVLVAWKDSKEAARAVFDALPLLKAAKEVEVLVVDGEDDAEKSAPMNAAEIAASLNRHGISVSVENEPSAGIPVAAVIENRLSDKGADLLVMGAYSRPRIAEMIFGGVTSTLLKSMVCPTFLSR